MISPLALAAFLATAARGETEVRLSVGGGARENLPVMAMPPFTGSDARKGNDALLAKQVRDIIRADLMLSRRFDARDEESGTTPPIVGATWRLRATAGQSADKISVQVRLENGAGGEAVFERFYRKTRSGCARFPTASPTTSSEPRQAATGWRVPASPSSTTNPVTRKFM